MTVINTNTAATLTANALTKNERAIEPSNGATIHWCTHKFS